MEHQCWKDWSRSKLGQKYQNQSDSACHNQGVADVESCAGCSTAKRRAVQGKNSVSLQNRQQLFAPLVVVAVSTANDGRLP